MAASNPVILEVLNRNNYKHWRSRMKTYLLSEDLWDVVEAISREPATAKLEVDDEAEYNKAWTKKNAKALYAIQNSCGREMFSFISEIETAKSAWEALERVSKVGGYVQEKSAHNFERYIPFHNSVSRGDWNKAKECLREVDVHSAVRAVDPRDGFEEDIALHVAAREGHVHIVKGLVQLMTLEDMKMKNAKGYTALHVAALHGQVHTVKELVLLMGEEKTSYGNTALHIAVHIEKVDMVKDLVLFMRQEDLKIRNNINGSTALHLAVNKGNVPIVKHLAMLMGEVRDRDGDTALHIAVKKERLDIVKELVRLMRREDLAIKNNIGYTAFHLAIKKGNVPIVRELVTKYEGHGENNIVAKDIFDRYIPFTTHVRNGNLDKAKQCLTQLDDPYDAITRVDPRDKRGDTALHVAVRARHVHIVKELVSLLKVRQDEDLKTAEHFTAFCSGVNLNGVDERVVMERAKYLVEQCEKTLSSILDVQNAKGSTALYLALSKQNADIVKELVPLMRRKGFEVKNNDGDTVLHIAIEKGNVDIVKQLVRSMRREEDLAIKNNEGYTAFHLAIKKGNVPIVRELVTKYEGHGENKIIAKDDFDRYISFTTNVTNGDWDNANECLRKLDDPCGAVTVVDPRNEYGDTALHVAAREGHVHILKELVSLLEVRQEEDLKLKTAQDFISFGSGINLGVSEQVVMEMAKYMVEQYEKMLSSILDVQNAKGSTALHIAVLKGNVDIVKELVLLMRQEGMEIKDADGDSPVQIAVSKGYVDIVKELVSLLRQEGLELKDADGDPPLQIAVRNGNVDIVKELLPFMRKEGLELKDADGDPPLQIAVKNGHMNIVKELMPFMRQEALEEKDGEGYTALGCALDVGKDEDVMEMAKYMAKKNNKVFGIPTPPGNWIPVVWACNESKWDLCRYLYPLTPLEFLMPENGIHGAQLISNCLREKELDMALDLLQRCPILAISPTGHNSPPIMELAGMHSAFLSGIQLGFWQKLIYNRMHIEPANLNIHDTNINISKKEDDQHHQMDLTCSVIRLYREFVNGLLKLLGADRLHKMKWIHTRSIDVLRCISEMVKKDSLTSLQLDIVKTLIFKAVEHGHVEFVTNMCRAHPPFVKSDGERNKNIFQFAVDCRQNKIYSLIHGLDKEDQRFFGLCETTFPENMLHLAGNLSPLSRFNCIRGPALQMQRELHWFKEVENIVPLEMHEVSNLDGMTPHELFTKNHEKLKEEAENSMKRTATSCTIVGALIVTIMFTVVFTVLGGNNGSTGAPMFLEEKLFLVFIISDTLSLVSSTTSVTLFLGILTSRYAEDDFLKNLPTKMMIGLFTLFLSIATMMIAFSSALVNMLDEKHSWAVIPSISVASIPVASFIWLQFPLLVEIFWSTYGPGIFDRKVKRWVEL